MKLQQFDGGQKTRKAPQFLAINEGVTFENVDITGGELEPLKDKLATDISVGLYNTYYTKGEEWIGADTPTSFLQFQNILYMADGDVAKKRYDGETNLLGIEPPTADAVAYAVDLAEPIKALTIQNNISTGDLGRGSISYRLYNVSDGIYSAPNEIIIAEVNALLSTLTEVESSEILDQTAITELDTTTVRTADGYVYVPTATSGVITASGSRSVNFSNISDEIYERAELYRYYDNTWYLVHTFYEAEDTEFSDTVLDISDNAELSEGVESAFNGTYQYLYTYYNNNDGSESVPSGLSDEIELASGKIKVAMGSTSADPQVTHKRIYRVGGYRTTFALVAQVDANVTVYQDVLKDSEMVGTLLESANYYAAPEGLAFLAESYAMLFGAVDYILYFTPVGKPNAWPSEYSIEFNAPITGIGAVSNGVLVMTATQTFIVTGTGPLTLAMQTLRGDQGCISHQSIREVENGAIVWASADGLCVSSGNNVKNITKDALGELTLDPVSSAVVDEVYYLHNSDGSTLVWDYRVSSVFRTLNVGVETLTAANSKLYGWADGLLYEMFQADTYTTMAYKSPRLTEGSLTETKTYKKVYISHDGDIIIDIVIDDVVVHSKTLEGKDTTVTQVPAAKQRGYYIQFIVTGTGKINEIQYTAEGRHDG